MATPAQVLSDALKGRGGGKGQEPGGQEAGSADGRRAGLAWGSCPSSPHTLCALSRFLLLPNFPEAPMPEPPPLGSLSGFSSFRPKGSLSALCWGLSGNSVHLSYPPTGLESPGTPRQGQGPTHVLSPPGADRHLGQVRTGELGQRCPLGTEAAWAPPPQEAGPLEPG